MTEAWVFTGGSARGVMKHVGEALANYPDIPCIGTPLAGNVVGVEVHATTRPRSQACAPHPFIARASLIRCFELT